MRASQRFMVFVLMIMTVAGCASSRWEEPLERTPRDSFCAEYLIDSVGYTLDDGLPVVDGITASRVTEACKLEIVAMHDFDVPDIPGVGAKPPSFLEITETADLWIKRWLKIEGERKISGQYLSVPAYTVQCWVNEDLDPDFLCPGEIIANHQVTTYQDAAFDLSGEFVVPLEIVDLKFGGGAGISGRESAFQGVASKSSLEMTPEHRAFWSAILVYHVVWEITGTAEVCIYADTLHCSAVDARVIRTEDYVLDRDIHRWDVLMNSFRTKIRKPQYDFIAEPYLPQKSLHRNYYGGPLTKNVGDGIPDWIVVWTNGASSLRRQDLKGFISVGIKLSVNLQDVVDSSATTAASIKYTPKTSGVRCFEVWTVGGSTEDPPLTGVVLKEGCTL